MSNEIRNYYGSIHTTPQQIICPETVEEIQAVLRDTVKYPSPLRAMGSYHSLTPCASSDGTIGHMKNMTKILAIDAKNNTFTAQAGLEFIDASKALRKHDTWIRRLLP